MIFVEEQRSKKQFDLDQCRDLLPSKKYNLRFSDLGDRRMKRRMWTAKDVRTLKRLAGKRTRAAKIGRALRRTEGATRQKAFSIGLSLGCKKKLMFAK
jgi:hypothetical protein